MGNVVQAGTKMNPARQAAVHAGLPVTVPALTVNRVCGSGAQAIVSAAQEISLGNINVAVAGGMENMDQAPYLVARGRWGYRLGDGQLYDSVLARRIERRLLGRSLRLAHRRSGREVPGHARGAGPLGVALAAAVREPRRRPGISRRRSCRSKCRARKGPTQFDKDEANRPDTTLEVLARLKPAFRPNGTITAGNAPGTE